VAIAARFSQTGPFSEGLAGAASEINRWGYVDPTGEYAIQPQFLVAREFHDGLAEVLLDVDTSAWHRAFPRPNGPASLDRVHAHGWIDRKTVGDRGAGSSNSRG